MVRKAKSARRVLLAACAAVLATAAGASAAIQTWNGGGADDNWTTSGNWLGGTAPVANDALLFDGTVRLTPNNNFAAGTAFNGISFTAAAGAFTLGGNSITLSGDIGDDAAGQFETINLGLALDANRNMRVSDSAFLNVNGVVSGNGFGITKTGNGTLTLGANNSYTRATIVGGGTLVYAVDSPNVAGLSLGITPFKDPTDPNGTTWIASTDAVTVDMSSANVTTSSLNLQTNTSTASTILIGGDKTLTVNGAFTVGAPQAYTKNVAGVVGNLNISGGSVVVNGGASHFIANPGRSNNAIGNNDPRVTLDMSNLTNFTYSGVTATGIVGEFRVGGGNGRATVSLANTANTITAASIRIGDSTATSNGDNNGNQGPRSTLHLGSGTNVLAANSFIIGSGKSGGALDFLTSSGTLRITGAAGGTSTANITIGSATSGTGTNDESQLLLGGHDVTVLAGNVIIGRLAGASVASTNSARGNVTFDTGTFKDNSIQLAVNTNGVAANVSGTFTLGGPIPGSSSTAVLNVANTFYLANRTNTNGDSPISTGTFAINGGTANINTDILDASTTVANAGANSTTLTLDGGTLNMSGHNIGTYSAPINTINLNSGTLNGAARIAGRVININPAVTINDSPTLVLSDAGSLISGLSPLTLASGGGLEGGGPTSGVVNGDVVAATGSHISPGSATSQGSLQFVNNLTLNDGSTVKFKLSENVGSGNDFINTGGLTLQGKVNLAIGALGLGPQNGNTYTVFSYTGTLTGNETNFNVLGDGSRSTYSVIPTNQTPGTIQLTVAAGNPLSLIWVGNNSDNWQTGAPANWKDASTAAA